jgi:hypothetical protein
MAQILALGGRSEIAIDNCMIGKFELPSNWEIYATKIQAQFLVNMDPMDFVSYTGGSWLKKILAEDRFSYEDYQKFKNQTTPPALFINLDEKRIRDHEGRHRAVAYQRAGGKDFQVVIKIDPAKENVKLSAIISDMFKHMFKPYQTVTWNTLPPIKQQFDSKTINVQKDWELVRELVKL